MKKTMSISLLIVVAVLSQSCALIFSGTKDKVKVSSSNEITGKVYYNGSYEGDGTVKVKVHKKSLQQAEITVQAPGYKTQDFKLSRKLKVGAFAMDCLTGFIWLIPDFATGAIYKAAPQSLVYNLEPDGTMVTDIKPGDAVLFSSGKLKNIEGTVKAIYPNRALITYKKDTGKPVEIEVPLVNIAKLK